MLPAMAKAWEWVKAHATLVGGLLIALLGVLLGVSIKKRPVIVVGDDPTKKKIEADVQQQEQDIKRQEQQQQQQITDQHQQDVQNVINQEQKQEPTLVNNDDGTNKYLQDIGQQVRGGGGNGGSG
jgi:predicted secreted Zn-dependent protease